MITILTGRKIQKYADCKTIRIFKDENSAKIMIDKKKEKATLKISDGRIYDLKVKKENGKLNIYKKKKEVYVLIKVKPKYTEEFCIMMVACRELCKRACKSKNLAKIDEVFSVLGPFDFLLELSGEGKNEGEMDKKINKTIFKIRETLGSYIDETCTLTKFDLPEFLKNKAKELFGKAKFFKEKKCDELNDFKEFFKETFMTHGDIHEHENNKVFSYQTFNRLCELREELECDTAKIQKTEVKNKTIKDVHVLIKIKPEYTEQFCVAMAVCKSLCNRASASQNLAKIDEVFSVFGLFDFLLEIKGEGEKINRTILKNRETLGSYINETLTITKFKIPMTKEELKKFFGKKLGGKYLVKLPDRDGETIPDENKPDDEIDLKEIYDAETTALKNLLKEAKTFLEPEDLNKRIVDLTNRVEELEKRS